jgi:hypothetical protein
LAKSGRNLISSTRTEESAAVSQRREFHAGCVRLHQISEKAAALGIIALLASGV